MRKKIFLIACIVVILITLFTPLIYGQVTCWEKSPPEQCTWNCRATSGCFSPGWVYKFTTTVPFEAPSEYYYTDPVTLDQYKAICTWFPPIPGRGGYSECDIYHWESVSVPCPIITNDKPAGTDCSVGGGAGECFSGSCYDCDYNDGEHGGGMYCIGGWTHEAALALVSPFGQDVCNSWYRASNTCCGDDPNEYYRVSRPIPPGDDSAACCPRVTDCVYASTCYVDGYSICNGANNRAWCNSGNLVEEICTFGCEFGGCKQGPKPENVIVVPNPVDAGVRAQISWTDPREFPP